MNLARILETSTAELPPIQHKAPPRLHPNLVVREHEERDSKIYLAVIPGGRPPHFFRLNEVQWRVCQLFDGERTPEKVSEVAAREIGIHLSVEDVRNFVDILERDDFWYHTPQEESVALWQEMVDQRRRRSKKGKDYGDLSTIVIASWDPDNFLNWVDKHFSWIYSRWFTYWSIFMLLVSLLILGSHWNQVWADSAEFYRLSGRGFSHFLAFLGAFFVLGFVHESAHGLTCKHFGGEVHRMGVLTIYLAPCVYCDVSQVWVYGKRLERMCTVFFGVWSEIVICTYASVIWWATPPGTFFHQWAYLTILAGGIFCVLLNWNPLAKMDGYMLMTEYFRIHDVKVASTAWLIAWIRKNVFHLPASVETLTPLRSVCYAVYAVLAGAYSYTLLLFFVRVLYTIVSYYVPQWAFVPATALALLIFKGRFKKLAKFMKELYLDKKDLLRAHWKPIAGGLAVLLVLGWLPLRRETTQERFVLEPVQRAVLRAQVPGRVVEIGADEGQRVPAGAMLAKLRDLSAQSETARAAAEYHVAEARAFDAQLRYADFGSAEQKLRGAQTAYRAARDKERELTINSPIAGVVVTPRVRDLLGSYVTEGTEIAELADTSTVHARIFVPEPEVKKLQAIHDVALRLDSQWRSVSGTVLSISPASQPPAAGLMEAPDYKGIRLPEFFVVTVAIANPLGEFRDGMTGTAKIHGRRRSMLGILLDPAVTAVARRLW
ncbi:MAG: HlyD family efflux transporter periplasmic adaptor subunit [Acidobacteriia bacterium]|nr:HlyD family efflux transporter periplasmic adaptor subunit [Terriglobia bacterium]